MVGRERMAWWGILAVLLPCVQTVSHAQRLDPPRPSDRLTESEEIISASSEVVTVQGRKVPLTSAMIAGAAVPTNVNQEIYPACPRSPRDARDGENDVERFARKLKESEWFSEPFPYVYFCDLFTPQFYADLVMHFPPVSVMEPAVKRLASQMKKAKGYSAQGSNNNADRRWKMSVFSILGMRSSPKDPKGRPKWGLLPQAKQTWTKLKEILFSKQVTDTLWNHFNLTRKPVFHDFRVQTDHTGYSIGVHPDSPKKILTLMFYVPLSSNTVYDFGTCLHSTTQYERRNLKKNGEAPCLKKFMFGSNTGYSFVVNDHSYHSVNTVGRDKGELRQTILVNWYDTIPKASKPNESTRGKR